MSCFLWSKLRFAERKDERADGQFRLQLHRNATGRVADPQVNRAAARLTLFIGQRRAQPESLIRSRPGFNASTPTTLTCAL